MFKYLKDIKNAKPVDEIINEGIKLSKVDEYSAKIVMFNNLYDLIGKERIKSAIFVTVFTFVLQSLVKIF